MPHDSHRLMFQICTLTVAIWNIFIRIVGKHERVLYSELKNVFGSELKQEDRRRTWMNARSINIAVNGKIYEKTESLFTLIQDIMVVCMMPWCMMSLAL